MNISKLVKGGNTALLAAALVLPAVGCTDKDTGGETGETGSSLCPDGFYDGPYQIAVIDLSCAEGTPDVWSYSATSDGYSGLIDVSIFETGDSTCYPSNPSACWDEQHDLVNTDFDADCGTYDDWAIELDDVATPGEVVSGSTTLLDCTFANNIGGANGSIAVKFTMFDDASDAIDCAISGFKADQYWNDSQGGLGGGTDCVCFDTDSDCTN